MKEWMSSRDEIISVTSQVTNKQIIESALNSTEKVLDTESDNETEKIPFENGLTSGQNYLF